MHYICNVSTSMSLRWNLCSVTVLVYIWSWIPNKDTVKNRQPSPSLYKPPFFACDNAVFLIACMFWSEITVQSHKNLRVCSLVYHSYDCFLMFIFILSTLRVKASGILLWHKCPCLHFPLPFHLAPPLLPKQKLFFSTEKTKTKTPRSQPKTGGSSWDNAWSNLQG